MSIQGSSLYPIIHTMDRGGNCHKVNAGELKLLLESLPPLSAGSAGTVMSILYLNHIFFDSV